MIHKYPAQGRLIAIGLPRTGTRFLAGMIADPWQAKHEFDMTRQAFVATSHLRGQALPSAVRNYLLWRRKSLGGASDISSINQDLADALVGPHNEEGPPETYVLTVRDPLEWVDAYARALTMWFGQQGVNAALRAARCRPDLWPHRPADRPLAESGLFSLDAYLYWWARSTSGVFGHLPQDRMLVVPTERLGEARAQLEAATGWPPEAFHPHERYRNSAPRWEGGQSIIDRLDPAHVAAVVERQLGGHDWGQVAAAMSPRTRSALDLHDA